MEMIQDLWTQFMELSCPLWIPVAAGLVVLLLIVIPLAVTRGKWKKKARQLEDEAGSLRTKAEQDVNKAKDNARKEIEKLQQDAEKKLEEARKEAQEEAQRLSAEADRKMEDVIRTSEMDLIAVKERMERILHEERETLQASKAEYEQMGEKELLVHALMALGGVGTRMDRMEKDLAEVGKRVKYQTGSGASASPEHFLSGGQGSTPLLDFLRDELNSVAQKK